MFQSLFESLVRATGVESQNGVGQIEDAIATETLQVESGYMVKESSIGHHEEHNGQQKDTFGALACRAGVEGNGENRVPADLLRLAMLWERIPSDVRRSWVITAEALIMHGTVRNQ